MTRPRLHWQPAADPSASHVPECTELPPTPPHLAALAQPSPAIGQTSPEITDSVVSHRNGSDVDAMSQIAMPVPPDAATLDSTAYPHIFDTIFEYAPYGSLLVLRATARALRTRADKRLLDYIMIFPNGRTASRLGPRGRLPRDDWAEDDELFDHPDS